jgi:hypothetical protein
VLLWTLLPVQVPPGHVSVSMQQVADSQAPDAGTAVVGDTAPTEPLASAHPPSEPEPLAQDLPPEPRPGQTRPDVKGRCPGRTHVIINGGCWVDHPSMAAEECTKSGYALLKGKCYAPTLEPPRGRICPPRAPRRLPEFSEATDTVGARLRVTLTPALSRRERELAAGWSAQPVRAGET